MVPDETECRVGDGDGASTSGTWIETSYDAYASARERFLATLRADAEIGRLERSWRLPSAIRGEGGE